MSTSLRSSALAFDAIAPGFDARFGAWRSVVAQRNVVRAALIETFPVGGHILEVGGGTGDDASFLAERGWNVLHTDPSPTMVSLARNKLEPLGSYAEVASAEEMDQFASRYLSSGGRQFDGAFSNFAPLNCVSDLEPVACGLARLLKPGAIAMLVLFGTLCPAEMLVEILHGRPGQAFRRGKRGEVRARLGQSEFHVVYHRRAEIVHAFAPWFKLERTLGVGVTVPPSAAEPWISRHPGILAVMENIDKIVARPMSILGDHVLYQFRRSV